jgi:hypothetical protein
MQCERVPNDHLPECGQQNLGSYCILLVEGKVVRRLLGWRRMVRTESFTMASSTAADLRDARRTSPTASTSFLVRFFEWFGDLGFFCFQLVRAVFLPPYEAREFAHQLDELGSKSLPLVALAGAATGVVLSLETRDSLVSFGAKSLLPALLVVSIIKESGPIITGLIVSGRVAAGIGAELGAMRITEQIDAMEASASIPTSTLQRRALWPACSCCRCLLWPRISVASSLAGPPIR